MNERPQYPTDFPSGPSNRIMDIAGEVGRRHLVAHRRENQYLTQYIAAHLAVEARWRSLSEADEEYTRLAKCGTQAGDDRRREDEAIFAFFTNALSAVETTGYQIYAMAGLFEPAMFSLVVTDPERVYFSTVCEAFDNDHPGEPISRALEALRLEPQLARIRTVRNILAHRGQPRREFPIRPPQVILPSGERHPPDPDGRQVASSAGLTLDENMTAEFRTVLADHLRSIFTAAAAFAEAYIRIM